MDTSSNLSLDQRTRIGRHHAPSFDLSLSKRAPILARRMMKALNAHDWNRNYAIRKLRREGAELQKRVLANGSVIKKAIKPRRIIMHKHRFETMTELAKAVVYHLEYDPHAPQLYECMASIEELAKSIGQLHEYEPGYDAAPDDPKSGRYTHGRKSCDPVHGVIEDWEAAGLIVVVREFDRDSGTYKASRLFLRPDWFRSIGFNRDEMIDMLRALRAWKAKKKKSDKHTRVRPITDRIANISKISLLNLLNRERLWFTGDDIAIKKAKEANDQTKRSPRTLTEAQKLTQKYRQFCLSYPPIQILEAEKAIRNEMPGIDQIALYQRVMANLQPNH